MGQDITNKKAIAVYPNPAGDFVVFEGAGNNAQVKFYDLLSKRVSTHSLLANNFKINLSEFRPGIYFFKIISEEKVLQTGKLIKD